MKKAGTECLKGKEKGGKRNEYLIKERKKGLENKA